MDKDVAHIYNWILLNHLKEQNWVLCSDVGGPGGCHTEWSQKNKCWILTHIYSI